MLYSSDVDETVRAIIDACRPEVGGNVGGMFPRSFGYGVYRLIMNSRLGLRQREWEHEGHRCPFVGGHNYWFVLDSYGRACL